MADLLNIGVRFGAEGVPSITKSIAELTAQMKRFQAGLNTSTGVDSIARLNKAIAETQVRIKNIQGFGGLPQSINATTQSMKPFTVGSNQAAFALQNVGRVAQDVPFGFLGIQNNLNPLLESFQRLKAETGSNSAAFKALGASLAGPAGIGIAISIISSVVLLFTNGMQSFAKKTREAADRAKEFVESLKSISDIQGEAFGSVQGDIANIQALGNVITDNTKSLALRKRALEELQQVNKSYFGDLTLEAEKLGLVTARVNEYTQSLIAQAVVKGFSEEISRVSIEFAKQQTQLSKLQTAYRQAQTNTENVGKAYHSTEKSLNTYDLSLLTAIKSEGAAKAAFQKQRDVVETLSTSFAELNGQMQDAVNQSLKFKDLTNAGNAANDKQDKILKSLKDNLEGYKTQLEVVNKLREKGVLPLFREDDALALQLKIFDALNKIDARELTLKLKPNLEIDPQLNALEVQESIDTAIERSGSKLTLKIQKIEVPKFDIGTGVGIGAGINLGIFDQLAEKLRAAAIAKVNFDRAIGEMAALKAFQDNVQKILVTGLIDAFSAAASGIGETLAGIFSGEGIGKGLVNTATNILKVIGGVLQQLGVEIVVASKAFLALKAALNLTGLGAPSLIAGIGLIAAGALLKSIKFPAFAQGGIAEGPQSGYLALLHGREMVTPLNSARNTLGIESGPQVIMIESRTRGEDIEYIVSKVMKRKNRTG